MADEEEYVAAKRLCYSKERLTVVLDMDEVRGTADPKPQGCIFSPQIRGGKAAVDRG